MKLSKFTLSNKKILLASGAFLFILALGFTAWTLRPVSKVEPDEQASFDEVLAAGAEYAFKGDADGGIAYFDKQAGKYEDKERKQQIMLEKSKFALQVDRAEIALEAARDAENIERNVASLSAVARAYDASGDREQAIAYYKNLIEILPEEGLNSRYISQWQLRIEELSS